MPALEQRYDQSSATESEEDFVNASPRPSHARRTSSSSAAQARPSSRTSAASGRPSSRASASRAAQIPAPLSESSSESELSDSEEERQLQEELADAGGIEAGTVRGAPKASRAEWVMRSVGKGGNAGSRAAQQYTALDDAEQGRAASGASNAGSSRRSSTRRSGTSGSARQSGAGASAGGEGVARSSSHRSKHHHKKRSSRSAGGGGTMYEVGKAPSSKAGSSPGGDPGAGTRIKGTPRSRKWIWLAVIGAIIAIALVAIIVTVVVKNNKSNSTKEADATAASDVASSASQTAASSGSASADASNALSTAQMPSSYGDTATFKAGTESAGSPTTTYNDGLYHASSAASATNQQPTATSQGIDQLGVSSAADPASQTSAANLGGFGSVPSDSVATATADSPSSASDSFGQLNTASQQQGQLGAASTDSLQAGQPASATSSADVWAQTTMSTDSATASSMDNGMGFGSPQETQQTQQQQQLTDGSTASSAGPDQWGNPGGPASSAATSIAFGMGPVSVSTGVPGGEMSTTDLWGGQVLDQFADHASRAASPTDGSSPATTTSPADPSQTAQASDGSWSSDSHSQWGGSWDQSQNQDQGQSGTWNGWSSWSDKSEENLGPYGNSTVYQATAPETYQTYTGNGTWFESSKHFGACGVATNDTDYVIALSNYQWLNSTAGDASATSPNCNAEVLVTNLANGLSIKAWVTERCATCVGDNSIDMSKAIFAALNANNLDTGILDVIWGFTGVTADTSVASAASSAAISSAPTSTTFSDDSGWFRRRATAEAKLNLTRRRVAL
ncbi:hypothetical protein JCM8097_003527 [Rhodosporidiobolus ruineniae]